MTVKETILAEFENVAREQGKAIVPLTDSTMLLESGLDSLCFAIIVARLEDTLGVDPFQTASDQSFPVTIGAFVKLYADASA
jgi:acyl carrier protein